MLRRLRRAIAELFDHVPGGISKSRDVQKLFGWEVREDGSLRPVGVFGDLPTTVAGIAAS